MSKKAATPKMMQKTPSWFGQFISQHRKLTVVMFVGLVLLLIIGLVKYNTYQNKFSSKDYAAIESAAERVMENVGAREMYRQKSCRYEAPEKFSSIKLYCTIELAAYLPYESDEQAISVAKALERETRRLGSVISDLPDFYEQPKNMLTWTSVNLKPPLPYRQCKFDIASNEKAKGLVNFLPEREEDDLIAIEFYCSAQSRGEYFPVTYRQGE